MDANITYFEDKPTPLQQAVWYFLDTKAEEHGRRRCVARYSVIAKAVGATKRGTLYASKWLQQHDHIAVYRRVSEYSTFAANEFLVMPTNPRKREKVYAVAAMVEQHPLVVLNYLARYEALIAGKTPVALGNLTLRDVADWIEFQDGTEHPYVGTFLDAVRDAGFYDAQRRFVW